VRRSIGLDRNHRQALLRSGIGEREEHQEVRHGALGLEIALLDPEPVALVTNGSETAESPGHRSREADLADYSAFAALKRELI
jgi:hypothetical protein